MELVNNNNGKPTTTSLIVAEIFGKEHKNVIRDIENLSCSENFNRLNFELIYYKDKMNREQRAYQMTKDGFSFLVMGYTGDKAGKFKEDFINAFNYYEQIARQIAKPKTNLQMLQETINAMVEQEQRVVALESEVTHIKAQITTRNEDYFTIAGYGTLISEPIDLTKASTLGRKATKICKNKNIATGEVYDPRFGRVKTYPTNVLREIFNR